MNTPADLAERMRRALLAPSGPNRFARSIGIPNDDSLEQLGQVAQALSGGTHDDDVPLLVGMAAYRSETREPGRQLGPGVRVTVRAGSDLDWLVWSATLGQVAGVDNGDWLPDLIATPQAGWILLLTEYEDEWRLYPEAPLA